MKASYPELTGLTLEGARAVAGRYATAVRQQFGPRIRRIVLYGSTARGDWTSESDIDILILLDKVERGDDDWLVDKAVSLGLLDEGYLLQPLFMAENDFEHLRQRERRFALDVLREGKDL